MSIRILIADDHEVIRTGLASLLAGTDIEIIAEAANGEGSREAGGKGPPDVILLDIRMPDGDGLATLEKLRSKVPGKSGRDALDLRQPDLHRAGRGPGGQRLRAQGLVARRHHHHHHRRGSRGVAFAGGRVAAGGQPR